MMNRSYDWLIQSACTVLILLEEYRVIVCDKCEILSVASAVFIVLAARPFHQLCAKIGLGISRPVQKYRATTRK